MTSCRHAHPFPLPHSGAIYGPPLALHHVEGSVTIVNDLMMGKFPMIPKLDFAGVDVRDVAAAHIKAMETKGVEGRCFTVPPHLFAPRRTNQRLTLMPHSHLPTPTTPFLQAASSASPVTFL